MEQIFIAQGIQIRDALQGKFLQDFLAANCDAKKGSVWTYPKGKGSAATHEVRVLYTQAEFGKALNTTDALVVYEGHSRFGQGPAFGPAGIPKIPDSATFPVNPWGVHFRMGYEATDTECVADLMGHSVTPTEYDLPSAPAKAFLPDSLVSAAKTAKAQAKAISSSKVKPKAVCGTNGAWRLFDSCEPTLATQATTRGDVPLKGRHYYSRTKTEFATAVAVGSADLDASLLACNLLFVSACSSHVHFYKALKNRRKALNSQCRFLLTAQLCAAAHATTFLEQVLVKGHDPKSRAGMRALLKALNGVRMSGAVGVY